MDKLDCLKVFIGVAQLGTFTAAANELNTTQSAVSKKIAWLEKQLRFTLFHRHARAIRLTPNGHHYLEFALQLTEDIDLFESQLRAEQTSIAGVLKLSVPSAFSVQLLAEPLSQFLTLHPNVTVDVSVSDKFADLVDDNIDIAIRASYLKDSGLKAKWLLDNELVYFAAPSYLDTHSPIESAMGLERHQCLTYSLATPSNVWYFPVKDAVQKVKVNEYIRSDSPEMLVQMARLGQGVAAMPRWMIEKDLNDGRLIQVLADLSTLKRPMYLVYKNVEHQPQRIRAFIDFLSDYFISTKAST